MEKLLPENSLLHDYRGYGGNAAFITSSKSGSVYYRTPHSQSAKPSLLSA
jgi:hypothetical protein